MKDKQFPTSDFYLSSVLVCLGFVLEGLDKTNRHRVNFLFRNTPELEKAVQSYWNKQLRIEPLELFESQRYLKNRIYGQ
jgi:hypothetical protein